jgi:hypothetical protein
MAIPMITGFEQKDLPVLNEALRKLGDVDTSSTRLIVWYVTGSLALGSDVSARIYSPWDKATTVQAKAFVKTAPVGDNIDIEIQLNGTTIGTLVIVDGTSSVTLTIAEDIVIGDYLTMDITNVGAPGTTGANLSVQLEIIV